MAEPLKNESLRQKQSRFARDMALLVLYIEARGYSCTFGECYRPPREAAANAATGAGIANSLHTQRLAVDLNLFSPEGKFLEDSLEHLPFGEFWESIGADHAWGGRFKVKDGNHYSLTPDGGRTR